MNEYNEKGKEKRYITAEKGKDRWRRKKSLPDDKRFQETLSCFYYFIDNTLF